MTAGATVCAGLILLGAAQFTSASHGAPALHEAASCGSPAAHAHDGPGTVTVTVKPTTILRVDADGAVLAASTNTGCAPHASDDVYLARPDGTVTPADRSVLRQHRWFGDFSRPGMYVTQQR